jgi:putative FmdB family regulatory protein
VPTYDYVCTACGHEVEVVHPLHGSGPAECSVCGGAMKKSFAPPTVHFKGSGWARKERSSGRPPSGKPKSSSGPAEGHASGETSSGSAAEAKSSGDGD